MPPPKRHAALRRRDWRSGPLRPWDYHGPAESLRGLSAARWPCAVAWESLTFSNKQQQASLGRCTRPSASEEAAGPPLAQAG